MGYAQEGILDVPDEELLVVYSPILETDPEEDRQDDPETDHEDDHQDDPEDDHEDDH